MKDLLSWFLKQNKLVSDPIPQDSFAMRIYRREQCREKASRLYGAVLLMKDTQRSLTAEECQEALSLCEELRECLEELAEGETKP